MPVSRDQMAVTLMGRAFRYGFRRTCVDDVARTLRISKKTICEACTSKDAMLEYELELAAVDQRRKVEERLTETTALGRARVRAHRALRPRAGSAARPAEGRPARRPHLLRPPGALRSVSAVHAEPPPRVARERPHSGVRVVRHEVEERDGARVGDLGERVHGNQPVTLRPGRDCFACGRE